MFRLMLIGLLLVGSFSVALAQAAEAGNQVIKNDGSERSPTQTKIELKLPKEEVLKHLVDDALDPPYSNVDGVKRGIDLFVNKDFDGARAALKAACKENLKLTPSGVLMGKLFFLAQFNQLGIAELEQAIGTNPQVPEPYLILADHLLQQGYFTGAELMFRHGWESTKYLGKESVRKRFKSCEIKIWAGMAAVAEAKKDWELVQAAIKNWIALDPGNAAAQLRLKGVLLKQENKDDIKQLTSTTFHIMRDKVAILKILVDDALDPPYSNVDGVKRGIDLFIDKDFDGARAALKAACEENSKLPPPGIQMAKLLFLTQAPQAIKFGVAELEQTITTDPNDPEPYLILADVIYQQGDITASDLMFRKGWEATTDLKKKEPNLKRLKVCEIKVWAGSAAVVEAKKDWELAQTAIKNWIKLDPYSAAAQHRLGRVLFKQEKTDIAGALEAFSSPLK